MGDPAGIGPELAVKTAQKYSSVYPDIDFLLYGSSDILREARDRFAPGYDLPEIVECGKLKFSDIQPGVCDAACGKLAYDTVKLAAEHALAGRVDAMVTCPVNKAAVNMAGIPFTGHTELIARDVCGCNDFAMMQSAGDLRVIFATTHIALREVADALTEERIVTVGKLLADAVRSEGVAGFKIACAALNPHAGENGNMGLEDENVVKPAIDSLRAAGIAVDGPFPPDTLFIESTRRKYAGIISHYHDQGHIPFKMLAFDRGVNSTLGIPVIRTSVDHGTAFEIAWQGIADTGSMSAALELAVKRAKNKGI